MSPRPTPRLVRVSPSRADGERAREEVVRLEPVSERPSLEEAFRRHSAAVASVGFKILGSRAEAEDLVQDVFLRARRWLDRIEEPAALRGWLTVARGRCSRSRGQWRRRERRRESRAGWSWCRWCVRGWRRERRKCRNCRHLGSGSASGGIGAGGSSGFGGPNAGNGGTGGSAGSEPYNDYLKTHTNNYGFVRLAASDQNQILSLTTTLAVPDEPSANTGTLFLWPGLQPGGANYEPIDNGVLQPVLTWGPTCAPNAPSNAYASWWVSAQYVNTFGHDAGYTGCLGGAGMNVEVGDELIMDMRLTGTIWHQTVTDSATQQRVSYDVDMHAQAQNYAEFAIEIYTENPAGDVIFTNTQIVFEDAQPGFCQPTTRGLNDFFTNPHMSADGKTCSIDRIVLRAKDVAATTPN